MARVLTFGLAAAGAVSLAGCQFVRDDINRTLGQRAGGPERAQADIAASQVTTIGVNAYLWRAALETLSFAPLAQTDSNGGVIVTEWYANPQNPSRAGQGDRDDPRPRPARRRAARHRRAPDADQNGQWVDAPVTAATVQRLEEIILTRARDLRRAAIAG